MDQILELNFISLSTSFLLLDMERRGEHQL